MSDIYYFDEEPLALSTIAALVQNEGKIALSDWCKKAIIDCRAYLDKAVEENEKPIYGINTGFGALCSVKIAADALHQLQENLVKSHACGMGDYVPLPIVKLMLLLKIKSLSLGYSGVQLCTVERLMDFYNYDVLPVVYTQGSLGASGDLSPLAHLSLPLIGCGEVWHEGEKKSAKTVFDEMGWSAIILQSKEGLALLNGTQFMSAYGVYLCIMSEKINQQADAIASISLKAFDGLQAPFNALLHAIRPHEGQVQTAKNMRFFLGNSSDDCLKEQVQDPYSFRCIPQVHGASKDALAYVKKVLTVEINSVTDNPTIFPEDNVLLSGGNFHGQIMAAAFDFLGISLATLGNISERRTYQLIAGQRGLPAFLSGNAGLNSGMMIPQYTAASIVSQNKQLATPASVDSIVSSNGQEDHVSMGANAATKCLTIAENVEKIIAIELLNASQAAYFRNDFEISNYMQTILTQFREEIPVITDDVVLYEPLHKALDFIKKWQNSIDY